MESHDSTKDTFGRGGASFRDSGEGVPTGSLRDAPGKAALSTDFPGQPFGPGDTITIVNAWNVGPTDHEPREWYDEAESLRQGRLRRWQAIR